jgi:hypothetical protein
MIPFNLHRRIPLIRRPFYQRDLAIAERNRFALERESLSSECDALADKLRSVQENPFIRRLFGKQPNSPFPPTPFGRTRGESPGDDLELVSRIAKSYRLASKETDHAPSYIWDDRADCHHEHRHTAHGGRDDSVGGPRMSCEIYGARSFHFRAVNSWLFDNV